MRKAKRSPVVVDVLERLADGHRVVWQSGDAESGRGLMIVAAVADRWGAVPRSKGPGKTVWAECVL